MALSPPLTDDLKILSRINEVAHLISSGEGPVLQSEFNIHRISLNQDKQLHITGYELINLAQGFPECC